MGLLAKAPASRVNALWQKLGLAVEYDWLRAPETGGVMVRGRAGASGGPFNLGEMTVTRCAVHLATGQVGHGYVQGRSKDHATQAALVDALMQTDNAARIDAEFLHPLMREISGRKAARAAKAAATKVDFFTLARGED